MDLTNLISNVGFPIAISIALFYQLIKNNEITREFQTTISKNTYTIERLVVLLEQSKEKER